MNPRQLNKELANAARELRARRERAKNETPAKKPVGALTCTLTPAPASRGIPPKAGNAATTPPIKELNTPFEIDPDPTPPYVELALFSGIARKQLEHLPASPKGFRALCATAIKFGGISVQDFEEKFGDAIPRDADTSLKEWPLPSPDKVRDILKFFSNLTEDQFTGSKHPWRHAQSHQPAEELTPQG